MSSASGRAALLGSGSLSTRKRPAPTGSASGLKPSPAKVSRALSQPLPGLSSASASVARTRHGESARCSWSSGWPRLRCAAEEMARPATSCVAASVASASFASASGELPWAAATSSGHSGRPSSPRASSSRFSSARRSSASGAAAAASASAIRLRRESVGSSVSRRWRSRSERSGLASPGAAKESCARACSNASAAGPAPRSIACGPSDASSKVSARFSPASPLLARARSSVSSAGFS